MVESPAARRGRRGARLAWRAGLLCSLGLIVSACAELSSQDETLPFEGSAPSLQILGEDVLAALTREDTATLERVRLSQEQHNAVVWPELPASRPEVNYPVDFAWENIELRNRRALGRLLLGFEGREATLQSVACRGERQSFETFYVETDCWVTFDLGSSGRFEAQLFKDVLVREGGFKIFRYYEGEPRRIR